jgi:flavorubredoxin
MSYDILKKDLYSVGVIDWNLRKFDVTGYTKFGSTYNSFLIIGNKKTALIDGSKSSFNDVFLANIKEVLPLTKIDYLIVQHTEPDHSGSILSIVEANPNIIVVSSLMGALLIKELINRPFNSQVIKDNMEISLGDKTLRFLSLPNLHWPDTFSTYVPELETIFTCDFFGAHYATKENLLSKINEKSAYEESYDYYFHSIMKPFSSYVRTALARIETLKFDLICNSHGPVIDIDIQGRIDKYKKWSAPVIKLSPKLVVIAYVSAYGFTSKMKDIIKLKLINSGFLVEDYDLSVIDHEVVLERLEVASGLLVGSPTIVNDMLLPVTTFMGKIITTVHGGILASAFGNYGWSGEAVHFILGRLKQVKMKIVDEGCRVRFSISKEKEAQIEAFADNFATELTK